MKKLYFLLLIIFITLTARGQVYTQLRSYGYAWNRGIFDSSMIIPYGDTIMNTISGRLGAIRVNKVDSTLCIWNGNKWIKQIGYNEKGLPNGVATLGSNGKIPSSQVTVVALGAVYVDTNTAQMLGHGSINIGAVSVRTNTDSGSYILYDTPSNRYVNWIKLSGSQVLSFNGRIGVVISRAGDYNTDSVAEGINNLYSTTARIQTVIWSDTVSNLATKKNLKDSTAIAKAYTVSYVNIALALYVKYSDTTLMLSSYIRNGDTSKYVPKNDSSYVKTVILTDDNVIYSTPINFTTSGKIATGVLSMNTQQPHTFLAASTIVQTIVPTFRTIVAADIPTLNQNTTGTSSNITGTLTAASFPALTGDITSIAGSLATTLSSTGISAATYGSSTVLPQITYDVKGRATAITTVTITPAESSITITDITTNNVSTNKHGLAPKLSGTATTYLDGTGLYSVPVGTTGILSKQVFTVTGTYTVPIGAISLEIEIVGGGGGGGGAIGVSSQTSVGGGGGAGNSGIIYLTSGLTATYNYTVGIAGTGGVGATPVAGTAGGNTIITDGTSTWTSNGGSGGGAGTNSGSALGCTAGGNGGTSSGIFFWNIGTGMAGGPGVRLIATSGIGYSGYGGNTDYGIGGISIFNSSAIGTTATGAGGGGAGGMAINSTSRNGGDGFRGQIIITARK